MGQEKTPLGLDPIDDKLVADLRAHTELLRRGIRIFDSLPIDMQERVMYEARKQYMEEARQARMEKR